MDTKFIDIGPGMKGINFSEWGGIEGFLAATSGGSSSVQTMRRIVPWMAKAQDMTALAVSELPFEVQDERNNIVDTSTDWKNALGGMPSPQALFYQLASSLCVGKAYVIPTTISRRVVSLQYCAPHTVQPDITSAGLQSLQRTTEQGQSGRYYPASDGERTPEMMYFWLPDSDVEIGPAETYPARNALLSAELLANMDSTIMQLAQRGFISPSVMMAKGMNNKADRDIAESWWNKFIRGWTTSIAKILNGDAMTVLKIGAGMDELRGIYPELSKQAIENIGTSYGIPAALFMSDMAFASEVNPLIKVWYTTSQFVKIYRTIEQTFNTQLLNRYKMHMVFRPETLDAFQEDEKQRSASFAVYVSAGIKHSIAAQMVGLELPDGVEFEDLDPDEPEPVPAQLAPVTVPPAPTEPDDDETPLDPAMVKDLQAWQEVALMRFRKGRGVAAEFECKALPDTIAEGIRSRLKMATSEGEVFAAFSLKVQQPDPMMVLSAQLQRANDLLEKELA